MLSTVPIFTAYAAILGLLAAVLTFKVILLRVQTGVESGDGGLASLMQALRAHGNFVEQAPIALILLASVEFTGGRPMLVHILGVALVIARLASAWALSRSIRQQPLRQFSGGLSDLLLVVMSLTILLALAGIR